MSERKLATIRKIDEITPIDGAEKIECATVWGWKVVVGKNQFKKDQLIIMCEIDSWIPSTIAPFLTKDGHFPKVFNGVEGERLRTVKLRNCLSQGLILKIENCFDVKNEGGKQYINIGVPLSYEDTNANISNFKSDNK